MHVADITMFYAAEGGGVRRYLEAKHAYLMHRGDRHSLVVPRQAAAFAPSARGVPAVPVPGAPGYGWATSVRAAARALVDQRPDVIEAGDPYGLAWAALRSARALSVPAVAFCHSDLPALATRFIGRGACRAANAYLRRLYGRFDLVFAASETMLDRLDAAGVQRIARQPLGVDLSLFHPARRTPIWRARAGVPPGARLAVYAGRLAPEKNLHVLAQAFEKLGPAHFLLLVGSGRRPRLPANARLLPYLRHAEDLAALLASADVFVHAGDQETFGMAALEALACGVPVVATRAGALAELVDEGVGAVVPPGDPEAFARGVREVLERDRGALALAARRRAESYAWSEVLAQLVCTYARLCGASRPALAASRATA